MKTIALYLRLSKDDGNANESDSITNQRDLLKDYIKRSPELSAYEQIEFIDDGVSGSTFNRPALNKMLKLASKTIDIILVKDLSRFGRNLIEVGNYLDQVFPFLGVRFISVNENYDSDNYKGSTAGFDIGLKALVYEMYSRDTSQKIKASKHNSLRRGEYIGGLPFYGYIKSDIFKNKLIANPDTAPVVRYIFKLASEGLKPFEITKKLNAEGILSPRMYLKSQGLDNVRGTKAVKSDEGIWITCTVRRILYDKRYTGVQISHKTERIDLHTKKIKKLPPEEWIITENAHEPIISKEQWDEAQKIFKKRGKSSATRDTNRNIFKGLIKCGTCGRTLSLFKDQSVPCYRCNNHKFVNDAKCKSIRLNEEVIKDIVITNIQKQVELFTNGKKKEDKSAILQNKIGKIQQNIEKSTHKKTVLFESLAFEKIKKDEFKQKIEEINTEIDQLADKKANLLCELNEFMAKTDDFPNSFEGFMYNKHINNEFLHHIMHKITIFEGNHLEISWKFDNQLERIG